MNNKRLIIPLLIFVVYLFSCSRNKKYVSISGFKTDNTTSVSFENKSFTFSPIKKGDTASHVYKFKNTGNSSLVITKIDVSCGCLVPDYPKKPVEPGKTDSITIRYTSKTKDGRQLGRLVFHMNTNPEENELILEGIVK